MAEELPRRGHAFQTTDLVFVDIETTGLLPREHELLEIAVVRVSQDWSDGEMPRFTKIDEWSIKIKPEHIETADPVSMKINNYTAGEWVDAVSVKEALTQFIEKTDGAIMVAHNVAFDSEFLNHYLALHGLSARMHYHRLDTVSMAFAKLHNTPDASRYSLMELCKYFGITNDRPHSALADALADFELFKKLLGL